MKKFNPSFVDYVGLFLIGLFCYLYAIFEVSFAELNIQIPFLNFPIFVGEILLMICSVLFVIKNFNSFYLKNTWHGLILAFLGFVFLKAIVGYLAWGPLALRHAVLFFYSLFAVFTYAFYRNEFFTKKMTVLLIFCLILPMATQLFNNWFLLTFSLLSFILIRSYPQKRIRKLLYFLLYISVPYYWFFRVARAIMLSNMLVGIYLIIIFYLFAKISKRIKALTIGVFISFFVAGWISMGLNVKMVTSIFDVRTIVNDFKYFNNYVNVKKPNYQMKEIKGVKIFSPNEKRFSSFGESELLAMGDNYFKSKSLQEEAEGVQKEVGLQQKQESLSKGIPSKDLFAKIIRRIKGLQAKTKIKVEAFMKNANVPAESNVSEELKAMDASYALSAIGNDVKKNNADISPEPGASKGIKAKMPLVPKINFRQLGFKMRKLPEVTGSRLDDGNVLFRLMIWKDAFSELFNRRPRPILGVDFGQPFRSVSIEILRWGEEVWTRDGWIDTHNSFIDLLYRGGIVGLLFICTILFLLVRMVVIVFVHKSVVGLLLCGIVINWFFAANFMLIFELPYTAIPAWSLLGLTFAYCQNLKKSS